jgi:hypothetical protein
MITKEFLEAEITAMQTELNKAQVFLVQTEAVVSAYKMLLTKFDEEITKE